MTKSWIWGAATLVAVAGAQPTLAQSIVAQAPERSALDVPVSKSEVLDFGRSFTKALIADPEVADVVPLNGHSLYVLGKKAGTTSLTVYSASGSLVGVVDVAVGPDIGTLKHQLADLLPSENIGVRMSNDAIVLTGVVKSSIAVDRARQLAETYAPGKVVNLMSVGSSQQVMLEVRFSEMQRNVAKQIGVNSAFTSGSGNFQGGTGSSAPTTALLTNQNGSPTIDIAGIVESFGLISGTFGIGSVRISGLLDALERKGVVTTLAEPNLVALSGEKASFLAGGEFPVPVAQSGLLGSGSAGGSAITVEFKPFGVSLAFTPTVLEDGIINLVVEPEVSAIDRSASITVNGLSIPGLSTRRARTTLELRDGQSFAIAGLLRRDFQDTVRQFPILGSLPIIGSLFRSTGFERGETELVIIVTPHLVSPVNGAKFVLPSERVQPPRENDLFFMGRTDSATPSVSTDDKPVTAPSAPAPAAAPAPAGDTTGAAEGPRANGASGGVDGAYGHIF